MSKNYREIPCNNPNIQPNTKAFTRGVCNILVSPPYLNSGWHLSISCAARYPTWDEIRDAWYDLVPDAGSRRAAMILPPKSEYINIHQNCFHIHELSDFLKEGIIQ